MVKQLHVDLVSVETKVWSGAAAMLVARTTEGELGVLPGHQPLIGRLAEPSLVRVKQPDGDERCYTVSGGFLSVTGAAATVLAEQCEPSAQQVAH
ncbi:MAG: F0F1 ATP synthase subunit epsilon [Dactylosporangium sp.]|nr:F0F1 ATP synthase subunit epsilon [Dactylosporangium sp.]NNJ60815.1 F0F1 ATP synthase subunit epsilon [Dactylosporangium sp.]